MNQMHNTGSFVVLALMIFATLSVYSSLKPWSFCDNFKKYKRMMFLRIDIPTSFTVGCFVLITYISYQENYYLSCFLSIIGLLGFPLLMAFYTKEKYYLLKQMEKRDGNKSLDNGLL